MLCAGIDAACLADMEQLDSLHQIDTLDVEFEDWSEEFEAAEEWAELLGRSCGTDAVGFATGRGKKPGHDVNQDACGTATWRTQEGFLAHAMILCDGHGPLGHLASRMTRNAILQELPKAVAEGGRRAERSCVR